MMRVEIGNHQWDVIIHPVRTRIAKDIASLGEIKAKLMASKKLNSLNFSVDVVNNIAYISGIAASEEEVSIVTQIAQEARFIKEVQNFVKVNKDKR